MVETTSGWGTIAIALALSMVHHVVVAQTTPKASEAGGEVGSPANAQLHLESTGGGVALKMSPFTLELDNALRDDIASGIQKARVALTQVRNARENAAEPPIAQNGAEAVTSGEAAASGEAAMPREVAASDAISSTPSPVEAATRGIAGLGVVGRTEEARESATTGEVKIEEIHFSPRSASLSPGAQRKTILAAQALLSQDARRIRVTGYSDTTGSRVRNKRLSERRASAVADLLVAHGIAPSLIEIIGRGEDDLPEPTANGVDEPLNRCVGIMAVH